MSRYNGRPDVRIEIPIDPPIRVTGEYNWRPAEFDLDVVKAIVDIGGSRAPLILYEGTWLCKNGNRFRRGFSTDDPAVVAISVKALDAVVLAAEAAAGLFGGEAS